MTGWHTTEHFIARAQERLPGVDPQSLASGITWAVDNFRSDLVWYLGRSKVNGHFCRVFGFKSLCGARGFCAVVSEKKGKLSFITVYEVEPWSN